MIDIQVGSYRIVQSLAKGGMGEVFLARHEIMDRSAVVKVLHPDLSQHKDQVARFFNEARAAASIQHPGIVDVFDVGYADGRAYIVMEHLRGENLAERLERDPFELAPAIAITRQLVGALRAAHERGIVHRDLKPENIYVVSDPDIPSGERVKILDFGVAKLAQEHSPSMTARGSIFGTPAYMAPEQCTDAAAVDHRADLYALGCIVYELLCGTPPFGRGGLELLASHLRDTPPPLHEHGVAVPDELDDLVMRLLAKAPADRFQSCDELIQALEATEPLSGLAMDRFSHPFISLPATASGPIALKPTLEPPDSSAEATPDDDNLPFAATVAPETARGSVQEVSRPGTLPRASSATTFFSAGQVRETGSPARPGQRHTSRMVALGALLVLGGGGALAIALGGSGERAMPAEPGRAPLVVVESPPDAQPAPAPEQRMLAKAERALDEHRWEDVIHEARAVITAFAERPDADERKQALALQERARNEQRNQWIYEAFTQAVNKDDIRGVAYGYGQLPKSSVYRAKATPRYRRTRDEWLAPRLAQASELGKKQRCDQIATLEIEVGFLFPESVEEIRAIETECRGGEPPRTVATAQVAPMTEAEVSMRAAAADVQETERHMKMAMGFRRRAIKRFMKMAEEPLRECGARHDMRGSMTLQFEISPEGKPQAIATDKGSEAFRECVQNVVGWPHFPPAPKATPVKHKVKLVP